MPRRHGRGLGGHFHAFPGSCGVVLAVFVGGQPALAMVSAKNPLQPAGKQPGGCKNSPAELLTG